MSWNVLDDIEEWLQNRAFEELRNFVDSHRRAKTLQRESAMMVRTRGKCKLLRRTQTTTVCETRFLKMRRSPVPSQKAPPSAQLANFII